MRGLNTSPEECDSESIRLRNPRPTLLCPSHRSMHARKRSIRLSGGSSSLMELRIGHKKLHEKQPLPPDDSGEKSVSTKDAPLSRDILYGVGHATIGTWAFKHFMRSALLTVDRRSIPHRTQTMQMTDRAETSHDRGNAGQ